MSQKSPKSQDKDDIDENLRRVYQRTLEEKVPDRFLNLLEQLKSSGTDPKGGKDS